MISLCFSCAEEYYNKNHLIFTTERKDSYELHDYYTLLTDNCHTACQQYMSRDVKYDRPSNVWISFSETTSNMYIIPSMAPHAMYLPSGLCTQSEPCHHTFLSHSSSTPSSDDMPFMEHSHLKHLHLWHAYNNTYNHSSHLTTTEAMHAGAHGL